MEVKLGGVVMLLCMAVQVALYAPDAEAVITCGQVQSGLLPCVGFLQGGALVPQCCTGVRTVVNAARTTIDRRNACNCLKAVSRSFGRNVNYGRAALIAGKCGVRIPFKIAPDTDCSRVG